jgi:hypothetical protein
MITDAVLLPVGVIGVARAEGIDQISIIFASGVFIANEQRDRCARRFALEQAGEDLNPVGFLPLGDMAGRAGLAAIEIVLDIVSGEQKSGRTTVDDAADRRSVAFAKRGDGEDVTESVPGHGRNGS